MGKEKKQNHHSTTLAHFLPDLASHKSANRAPNSDDSFSPTKSTLKKLERFTVHEKVKGWDGFLETTNHETQTQETKHETTPEKLEQIPITITSTKSNALRNSSELSSYMKKLLEIDPEKYRKVRDKGLKEIEKKSRFTGLTFEEIKKLDREKQNDEWKAILDKIEEEGENFRPQTSRPKSEIRPTTTETIKAQTPRKPPVPKFSKTSDSYHVR